MSKTLFLSFCILFNIILVSGQRHTPVIESKSGPIRGIISTTIENVAYAAFKGIPYAKPPVNDLRFKPPVEIYSWTDVHDAIAEGSVCTQFDVINTKSLIGSEDCLYLNIFTPHTEFSSSISKPVMVWIYGGSFTAGNSNQSYYGPDFILGEDVIMVSFNYRVSALGFLNLEHENATGNCGLKDQTMALKWVKENIAQFGGNPDNITIFGQSAGGVSVGLHIVSDMSAGLFKQSIAMSGAPLCILTGNLQSGKEATDKGFQLGSKLGTTTKSKDILLKTLYKASAIDIILAATAIGPAPFIPSIEKSDIAVNEKKFLTGCLLTKYINGNYTKGPHMTGFTSNETLSFAGSIDDYLKKTVSDLDSLGSFLNKIPVLSDLKNAIVNGLGNLTKATVYNLIQLTTNLFVIVVDTTQKYMSSKNDHPIYYYRFSFDSNYSLHRSINISLNGVGHADELPYLFYMPWVNLPLNQPDIATTRKRFVKLWTNFAKYGNPTPSGKNDQILGVTWPDSRANGDHLEIGKDLTTGPRPTDSAVKTVQLLGICSSPSFYHCDNSFVTNVMSGFRGTKNLFG